MSAATSSASGGTQSLRPRARLLQTLGIDLISSESVALIELVKNGYDADATQVVVRFTGPLTAGSGSVEILDDGHGMSEERLKSTWLEIATPFRKGQPLSESGRRRVLGEKGIGRFAAARLAAVMHLTTCRDEREVDVILDWGAFEDDDLYLDQVSVDWEAGPPEVFAPRGEAEEIRGLLDAPPAAAGHGTLIRLDRLRRDWTREDVIDLKRSLARLITPRAGDARPEFTIVFDLPDSLVDLSGEIGPPEELEQPPYRLTGKVTADGIADVLVAIADTEPEPFIERIPLAGGKEPVCGPFDIDLRVWDRDAPSIKTMSPGTRVVDFRKLLDVSAGVSVYRDGFRVLPFGERGDDWLELDRRRVNNPSLRVSNNQVIGQVSITADNNRGLRDQSNREGLIHGSAYDDFRQLVRGALMLLETRRFQHRRKKEPEAGTEPTGGVFSHFDLKPVRDAINERHPDDRQLVQVLNEREIDISVGVRHVQEELARYQRLVTLGGLVDRVVHDGRTSNGRIKNLVRFSRRDLAKLSISCDERLLMLENHLSDIASQTDFISDLFRRIEPFGGRKRGRPTPFTIEDAIRDGVRVLESQLTKAAIEVQLPIGETTVRADPSEVQEIIVNLVDNACYWLSTQPKNLPRRIAIDLHREGDGVAIIVSDSGPGVPERARDMIFEPYYSQRPDGVGLGLAIVGSIVSDFYNGQLSLLDRGCLAGATFKATLNRRV